MVQTMTQAAAEERPAGRPEGRERVEPRRARTGRWFVVSVLALAALVRIAVVVVDDDYVPVNDSLHFDLLATSIANGDGFGEAALPFADGPTAYRAPLYPLTLGAVYAVAGDHSWTAGRLANALVGTVLVGLVGLVSSQLWSRRVGAVALVLAAVHPTLVLHGSGLQLEATLATLALAATAAALQHRRAPRGLWWPAAAGVLAGLAILSRETGLLLLPGLALLVWTARAGGERRWAAPALVVGLAVATVAPWTIRNAVALDAFVPVSTSGGYSLAGTYNQTSLDHPDFPGIWLPAEQDPHLRDVIVEAAPLTEVELDRTMREEAIDFVLDDPLSVPEVAFWNTVRLFDLDGTEHALHYARFVPYPHTLTRVAVYSSWLVGLAALAGLARRAGRGTPLAVWIFPLAVLCLHAALSGTIRYRASIEPFTVALAAFGAVAVVDRLRATASVTGRSA